MPKIFVKDLLTPYQGPNRVYGYFKCTICRRKWESGNSWANYGQQCKRCKINIYPYRQENLQRNEEEEEEEEVSHIDKNKPHLSSLCQKCKKLGRNCRNL